MVHSGPVDDVGNGEETVEIMAYHDDLSVLLAEFEGSASVKRENGQYLVKMKDGFKSHDVNKFLFQKGIVASRLHTQKKSLEKQFLEILAEADSMAVKK
jgi:ABC-2 type transport system ATP-binding protein